jgi:hypothetical protein
VTVIICHRFQLYHVAMFAAEIPFCGGSWVLVSMQTSHLSIHCIAVKLLS